MKSLRHTLFAALFSTVAALLAAPAAAYDQYVQVTGDATGPGTCGITIESFGEPNGPESATPRARAAAEYHVDVPIAAGSTAQQSAFRIQQELRAALPPDFEVTLHAGQANIIRIFRPVGTFTTAIQENVPGQSYSVSNQIYLPALGGLSAALLAMLLAVVAAVWLGRRRTRTA